MNLFKRLYKQHQRNKNLCPNCEYSICVSNNSPCYTCSTGERFEQRTWYRKPDGSIENCK